MDKRYEILDGLPTYGEMAIPIVDEDDIFVSEGYVVKFYKDDGSGWIANFPKGSSQLSFVKEFDNHTILVIAGGEGYIMNPNQEKPIKEFYNLIENIVELDDGGLIFATITDIVHLDKSGIILWEKEDIFWDGIKDLSIVGNKLVGYCFDITTKKDEESWKKFIINLETQKMEGGCTPIKLKNKLWHRYIWVVGFFFLLFYQLSR